MATFQVLYWHDIPVQVKAFDGEGRVNQPLPERFIAAVDSAAMAAGLTDADSYAVGYRWTEPAERGGMAEQVVEAVIAELDAAHPTVNWQRTAETLLSGHAP